MDNVCLFCGEPAQVRKVSLRITGVPRGLSYIRCASCEVYYYAERTLLRTGLRPGEHEKLRQRVQAANSRGATLALYWAAVGTQSREYMPAGRSEK